ncbi:unnamed protein product, partial [Didymodactylos carnosus]
FLLIMEKDSTYTGQKDKRTLALIKPDAIQNPNEIKDMILENGFTIVQKRQVTLTAEQCSILADVQCDLMNPLDLASKMEDHDVALSTLGQAGLQISAMTFYEDSMKSIITAMRNSKIKHLICITAFYTKCKAEQERNVNYERI